MTRNQNNWGHRERFPVPSIKLNLQHYHHSIGRFAVASFADSCDVIFQIHNLIGYVYPLGNLGILYFGRRLR